jgi:hypothetical protein
MTVAAAKEELSLPQESILLLTVAAQYKFESLEIPTFVDLLRDELLENASLILIGVGPRPYGVWGELTSSIPDRVFAVGPVAHPFLYRHAADVYLDSFPFCSTTSLLESALLGTAALAFTPERHADSVAFADLESLDDLLRADTAESYRKYLRLLATDEGFRADVGGRLRARVTDVHAAERWKEHLEATYRRILVTRRPDCRNQAGGSHSERSGSVDREVVRIGGRRDSSPVLEVLADRRARRVSSVVQRVSWSMFHLQPVLRRLGVPERVVSHVAATLERASLQLLGCSRRANKQWGVSERRGR